VCVCGDRQPLCFTCRELVEDSGDMMVTMGSAGCLSYFVVWLNVELNLLACQGAHSTKVGVISFFAFTRMEL
jgi:hypothetical protein